MAIGSCRTCQEKVADTAISCPHCGAVFPNTNLVKKLRGTIKKSGDTAVDVIVIVVMVFGAISILSFFFRIYS